MSSPKLRVIFRPKSEIQTFFSPKFRWSPKKKKKKKKRSSPKLRLIFRPKSEIQTFFSPKFRWSPKKVFTKIETDFSPDSLRFGRWGGMHPEMEPNYSKQRLIFRPKSLLLGWWGDASPPSPPPKSATGPALSWRGKCDVFLLELHSAIAQSKLARKNDVTDFARLYIHLQN